MWTLKCFTFYMREPALWASSLLDCRSQWKADSKLNTLEIPRGHKDKTVMMLGGDEEYPGPWAGTKHYL